jgi:hypothetical protein
MRIMLAWIGRLWSLPLSFVGLFMATIGGLRFIRVRDGSLQIGVLRLVGAGNIIGQTWGEVILTTPSGDDSEGLWCHELVHRNQARVLGVLFLVVYPLGMLMTALIPGAHYYRDCPLEAQAQKLARRTKGGGG